MMLEDLSEEQKQMVEQFEAIAGIGRDDETASKVAQMLRIFGWNLNNAVSDYFDRQFDALETPLSRGAEPDGVSTSGVEAFDTDIAQLSRREAHDGNQFIFRPSMDDMSTSFSQSDHTVNLQDQFIYEGLIPKLPRAPRISNNWQLDLGIHSSLKSGYSSASGTGNPANAVRPSPDTSFDAEQGSGSSRSSRTRNPVLHVLWVLVFVLPKTFVQFLLSAFRQLFGDNANLSLNKMPKKFDYDNYDINYHFLEWLQEKLSDCGQLSNHLPQSAEGEDQGEKVSFVANSTLTDSSTLVDNQSPQVSPDHSKSKSLLDNFNISSSNFNDVHSASQHDFDWSLVILINDNEDTQNFLTSLILDTFFYKLFNKEDGSFRETRLFVNNINKSPEAFEVATTYKVKRLPYIMLAANVTNNPSMMASMSVLYRSNISLSYITPSECPNTIMKILKNLNKILEHFNPQLVSQRYDKKEYEISRILREQQDKAYTESLEKDKLKKIEKENKLKEKQKEEERIQQRKTFLESLLATSWFDNQLADSEEKTKISLKLPSGKRLVQVIPKTFTLNELYLFVELKLYVHELLECPDNEFRTESDIIARKSDTRLPDVLSFEEYFSKYSFAFELIQPYPKKVFPPSPDMISSIPELKAGSNLLVEWTEESSEDGESDENI